MARDTGGPGPDRSPCNGRSAVLVQSARKAPPERTVRGPTAACSPDKNIANRSATARDIGTCRRSGYGWRPDSASFSLAKKAL